MDWRTSYNFGGGANGRSNRSDSVISPKEHEQGMEAIGGKIKS